MKEKSQKEPTLQELIPSLREQLIKERKELLGQVVGLQEGLKEQDGARSSEDEDNQEEEIVGVAALTKERLAEIDAALKKMEEGTYGICEISGKPIPLNRLQFMPWVTCTVQAQEELEKKQRLSRRSY